ncbi:MAG: DegT/DnrJ/EryC1/StrS family aminotransferase [Pedosphaera sp.]|nr:DegT/DnrJ/EryC1/StrS family aminotransferase [Pedosphaera sp.]
MANQLAVKGGTPVRTKPFISWPIIGDEERKLLLEVYDSGVWAFGGPREAEFAKKFAEFCGAKEALCVTNGSISLELALRALGVGPGDEVIVPGLTWLATAWAAVQVGATPVFADIREVDWCIDPEDVRRKISPRTKAIIPVHLYNQCAEMDELVEIAKKHSLAIVEDCAHAHGSQWNGRGIGTIGNIGSFSFQQSKAMTAGEGGVLTTNDEALAQKIYGLKNCGRPWRDGKCGFGGNYRITELQAALLLPQLARFESQLKTKTESIARFREKMAKVPGVKLTPPKSKVTRQGLYGVSLNYDPDAFAGMTQDILVSALKAEGIPTQVPYSPVYLSPLWTPGRDLIRCEPGVKPEDRLGLKSKCPVTERVAQETGIVILHHIFLGPATDADEIAAAFEKVQANAGELRMDILQKKAKSAVRGILSKVGIGV